MKEYLEQRIKHLKNVEMEYWNKAYDEQYPKFQRDVYRNFERAFEARRQECEMTLKFLNEDKNGLGDEGRD